MNDAPILSHFLRVEADPPSPLLTAHHLSPASIAKECRVGPNPGELEAGGPAWGSTVRKEAITSSSSLLAIGSKRKRDESDDDGQQQNGECNSSSSSFAHAVETFLSSGCCVIPEQVLPLQFVQKAKERAHADLAFLDLELETRRHQALKNNHPALMASVQRTDFAEMVARDGGRCDVRFQLDRFPFTAPGLVYNSLVFPLVQELLGGGDVTLLYAGFMWAQNNHEVPANPQKWHADGGHLFHHAHQPPHCINVFYPLVDLTPENGPTEFRIGTHRLGKLNNQYPSSSLCCKAGGAVLFDYRLLHRGGANLSNEPRPVLYLAYAKPFFRDTGNLRSGKNLVTSKPSPSWVARILSGEAMMVGKGFEDDSSSTGTSTSHSVKGASAGSGERWVLFQMNVEIGESGESAIIVVYNGDVAAEIAAQFCQTRNLGDDFVPILTEALQQQMDAALEQHAAETK